ncbi:hypothetical protein CIPAW_15G067600 [Carya illinoinensis]|uniref:Uncharacterized protein n=1 Tax=Carya illinoinensis TaxID=32201 RepID=A0A8T1NC65_CARIL|nr:hypothetical protein CIPAW_15G067600 [Carya illinoinensis]
MGFGIFDQKPTYSSFSTTDTALLQSVPTGHHLILWTDPSIGQQNHYILYATSLQDSRLHPKHLLQQDKTREHAGQSLPLWCKLDKIPPSQSFSLLVCPS